MRLGNHYNILKFHNALEKFQITFYENVEMCMIFINLEKKTCENITKELFHQ